MDKKTQTKDRSLMSHFLIVGIGVFINMAIGLISTPFITRVVDPAEYGRVNLFITYAGIFLSTVFLGLDAALIRFFYDFEEAKQKKLLSMCIRLPLLATAVVALIVTLGNRIGFGPFRMFEGQYLILLVLFLVINILNTLSMNLLRLIYKSEVYSISNIIQKVVYCLVVVLLMFVKRNYHFYILLGANIASFAASAAIAIVSTRQYWHSDDAKVSIDRDPILRYSIPLTAYNILFSMFDSLDKLQVERYCSETEVGIYISALSVVGIMVLIKTSFDVIWYPAQTEHMEQEDGKEFIRKGNAYITILMFFVGINVIVFKDVLCLILGEAYRSASSTIPFLIFNPVMSSISLTTVSGIEKSKKSYIHIIIAAGCLLMQYVMGGLLIPRMGLSGAAISVALSYILLFVLRLFFSNRFYYIDYGFTRTMVMVALTFILAYLCTFRSFDVLTVILYLLCMIGLYLLYKNDIRDMFRLFRDDILKKVGRR